MRLRHSTGFRVAPSIPEGWISRSVFPGQKVVQALSRVWLCDPMDCSTPGVPVHQQFLELAQTPCPSSWWCSHLILCHLLTISSSVVPFSSHLESFPALGSFPVSQFFASGGQSIGALASVLPMNIQSWFLLGWTGWISLQSKGLSRVFPAPQFKSINSSALSLFYHPALTSIHVYWKKQKN